MEKPVNVIDMGDAGLYATPEDMESLVFGANVYDLLYIPARNIAYQDGLKLRPADFKMMALNTDKIITIEQDDPRQAVLITEEDD